MRYKPDHTCFRGMECPGCAFDLGEMLAKRRPTTKSCKYVWMVVGSDNPCDIRRYAFSHKQGVEQLNHAKKRHFRSNDGRGGVWRLFKLVPVNRVSPKQ